MIMMDQTRTFGFGTFVDIGAERDGQILSLKCSNFRDSLLRQLFHVSCRGLLKPWFTFKGEEPSFKRGDKVKAWSGVFAP